MRRSALECPNSRPPNIQIRYLPRLDATMCVIQFLSRPARIRIEKWTYHHNEYFRPCRNLASAPFALNNLQMP
jgi:hypothetical protein